MANWGSSGAWYGGAKGDGYTETNFANSDGHIATDYANGDGQTTVNVTNGADHADTNGTQDHDFVNEAVDNSVYEAQVKQAGWRDKVPIDYDDLQRPSGDYDNWHARSAVYQWKDEFGDVGPEIPELEVQLFGGENQMRQGHQIEALQFKVRVDGPRQYLPVRSFQEAGLHPVILDNVVAKMGYMHPTPIQSYTIPAILADHDVLAIAQTGSGKTASYLVPVISKLCGKAKKLAGPRADIFQPGYNPRLHRVTAQPLIVVVVPTRELAMQVFDEARRLCYRTMLRPCVVYGGLPMSISLDELGKGCDILIGTPGRLCDIMDKPTVLSMSRIKFTIIDEADELLHDDWSEELTKIMSGSDKAGDVDCRYLMFSATFPREIRKLATKYMDLDYYRLCVGRVGSTHKNVKQDIIYVDRNQKQEALYALLCSGEPCRTLIFCNSKIAVDLLDDFLYNRGLPTTSIHSDRLQREREDAIRSFRTGSTPIMIATGVSARGMDIAEINHVINFDLPSLMHGGINEYIHRIGRTARIGNTGLASSFYNERDEDMAQSLVNILVESGSDVPEFLSHLSPEDTSAPIMFDDDSDDSNEDVEVGGAEAKGNDGGDTFAAPATAPNAGVWSVDGGAPAAAGWGGDGGAPAAAGWGGDGGAPAAAGWGSNAAGQRSEAGAFSAAPIASAW